MHPRLCASALAAVLLTFTLLPPAPLAAAASAPPVLRVVELLPNPDPALGQREFVELRNVSNQTVELAGWTLRDAPTTSGSRNEYTFTSGRLAPDARIVVWSNGSADARGPSWSTSAGKTVWNDAGDAVTLLDPAATVVDWLAYGNANEPAPPGFGGTKPSAPARGQSLVLDGAVWSAGSPSPGLAPGASGAVATATVANVAPAVSLAGLPDVVKPGQAVTLALTVTDGNGAGDLATWSLTTNGAILAQGAGVAPATVPAVAPAVAGPWSLVLSATDAGGLTASQSAVAQVKDARLSLQVAGGALRFPELHPGDVNVTALDWATLGNDGTQATAPLLDVSPFTGPATIPVEGRLQVGVQTNDQTTWIRYGGPLTPLPVLAPGASLRITLRLADVPSPLPAGAYGTSFAVVAA